jgi:hypothetical protein
MSITIKNRWLLLGLTILLSGMFVAGRYSGHRKADRVSSQVISALTDTLNMYKYVIKETTKTAVEREQTINTQREAIKQHLIDKEELRKLNIKKVAEVTSLKGEIVILKDSLEHTGNIIIVLPCDSIAKPKPAIELPFTFSQQDKYLNLRGGFDIKGKMNIDIKMPLAVDVWTGYDNKRKLYKAVLTYDNPYLETIDITSVKIDIPKPFYNKLWFRATTLSVAFVSGMLVAK